MVDLADAHSIFPFSGRILIISLQRNISLQSLSVNTDILRTGHLREGA